MTNSPAIPRRWGAVVTNAVFMKLRLTSLTKMKRLLQFCCSVAATLQQLDMYATTGGDKVAN